MATNDISGPLGRMVTLIEALTDIGLVWPHDIMSRKDLRPLVVSEISGVDTMRAWWITGPPMQSRPMTSNPAAWIERTWTYQIHGIEGLVETGSSIETLRANALRISDAIDAEPDLNGTCHRTFPSTWSLPPENRSAWGGIGASYVVISKTVITLSTP